MQQKQIIILILMAFKTNIQKSLPGKTSLITETVALVTTSPSLLNASNLLMENLITIIGSLIAFIF